MEVIKEKYPPKKELYLELCKKANAFDLLMKVWCKAILEKNPNKVSLIGNECARKLWEESTPKEYFKGIVDALTLDKPEHASMIKHMFIDELIGIAVCDMPEEGM